MIFKRLFNWLKLKSISPQTLYRNRLFIERDSKTRRVMSNFGLTFRNSKWSDYTLNNVSLQSVERAKRLTIYLISTLATLTLILTTDLLSYLNVEVIGLQSCKESVWLFYDYSTLTLMLMFTSYRAVLSSSILYVYDNVMIKILRTSTNPKAPTWPSQTDTNIKTVLTSREENKITIPLQLQRLLATTALTLPSDNSLFQKNLLMELYKTPKTSESYLSTLTFYKTLFLTTDYLIQTKSSSTINSLPQDTMLSFRYWKLLMINDFQPHFNIILNFLLQNKNNQLLTPSRTTGFNKLDTSNWDLVRCETEISKKLSNKVWSNGSFYYSSLDMNKLNFLSTNAATYTLWDNTIQQQTKFFKWMRWLYRYNILHRNVINYSHKVTNVKKLLSSGFFSSNLTKSNLWASNLVNSQGGNDLLVTTWSSLYGDLFKNNSCSSNNQHLSPLINGSSSLNNLNFYEQSYFFYLHRFDNFNTLGNLLVSSNYSPINSKINNGDSVSPKNVSNSTVLDLSLRSFSLVNKPFLTQSLSTNNQTILSKLSKSRSKSLNSSEVFMLESSKNFLTDSSNIDTLLNLTEVSKSNSTKLPYFSHIPSQLNSKDLWSWNLSDSRKTNQLPYTFLYLDALYTSDLGLISKFFTKK